MLKGLTWQREYQKTQTGHGVVYTFFATAYHGLVGWFFRSGTQNKFFQPPFIFNDFRHKQMPNCIVHMYMLHAYICSVLKNSQKYNIHVICMFMLYTYIPIAKRCHYTNCQFPWAEVEMFQILQAPVVKRYPAKLTLTSFTCFFGLIQFLVIAAFVETDLEHWKIQSGEEIFTILYAVNTLLLSFSCNTIIWFSISCLYLKLFSLCLF